MRRDKPSIGWVSISVYARLYGIDRATVYKWLALPGVLETYRVGRCVRLRNQPPQRPLAPFHKSGRQDP